MQLAVAGRAAEQVSATESVEADPGSCADLPVGRGSSGVKAGTGTICGKTCQTGTDPVSYTHLDVYKRQIWSRF